MATAPVQFSMTRAAPIIWVWAVSPKPENTVQKIPASYQATFLLDPAEEDVASINRICGELAMAEFGTYEGKKMPIRLGDTDADAAKRMTPPRDKEFLRGKVILQAHSKVKKMDGTLANPPRLIVYNKVTGKYERFSEPHERAQAQPKFYSGVYATGSFAFATYSGFGGGVTAYLNELVSFNVGDKIITGVDDNERLGDASKYVGHVGVSSPINPMAAGPLGAPAPLPIAGSGPLAGFV